MEYMSKEAIKDVLDKLAVGDDVVITRHSGGEKGKEGAWDYMDGTVKAIREKTLLISCEGDRVVRKDAIITIVIRNRS